MQNKEQNKGNGKKQRLWSLEIGLYPGILFGFRTYEQEDHSIHVMYLPFVDIAFYING